MSLAFSSRRSSCSRRTKGGGAAANHLGYNNWNNVEISHASPESIAKAQELVALQNEYLASVNIKPYKPNANSYNTMSNVWQSYKKRYGRDPSSNAAKYANNVYAKLHSNKGRSHNVNVIKATAKRKVLQPNPIKRLFGRSRRNRHTRRN